MLAAALGLPIKLAEQRALMEVMLADMVARGVLAGASGSRSQRDSYDSSWFESAASAFLVV